MRRHNEERRKIFFDSSYFFKSHLLNFKNLDLGLIQ